jgi:hypothetical protein
MSKCDETVYRASENYALFGKIRGTTAEKTYVAGFPLYSGTGMYRFLEEHANSGTLIVNDRRRLHGPLFLSALETCV